MLFIKTGMEQGRKKMSRIKETAKRAIKKARELGFTGLADLDQNGTPAQKAEVKAFADQK